MVSRRPEGDSSPISPRTNFSDDSARNRDRSRLGEGLDGRRNATSDERFRSLNRALAVFLPPKEETQLKPLNADFQKYENRMAHRTDDYESEELIIRRGQEFQVTVTFDRVYRPESDQIILQFATGKKPQESKGSLVRVTLRDVLTPKQWGMKIKEVSVIPSANAIIGRYEVFLETKTRDSDGKLSVFRRKEDEIVCILFNAWCQDDVAYMDNEEERLEYVLADHGRIWVGSEWSNWGIPWVFGQFEDVSLNCALWLLDNSGLAEHPEAKSSPIPIVRTLSAQVNFDDEDGGLLLGRWSEPYTDGTKPTGWTGSVNILEEFWKTKNHVKYGQCWVFSGLVTTLLRALGLPTRSVTNFQSAHDHDRSLTIDTHFDKNGDPIKEWDDSVWNFHVWNESWFKRPDLPAGHDGWQAHDATPQETSEGIYRCGPASLKAIKNAEVYLPYDTGFIFAEVNGDKVRWDVDFSDNSVKAFVTEKSAVGKKISTKLPSQNSARSRLDVTNDYKYPEGTEEERRAVEMAYNFSSRKASFNIYEVEEGDVAISLDWPNDLKFGDSFDVKVVVTNSSNYKRTLNLKITSTMAFYTGIAGKASPEMVRKGEMVTVTASFKNETLASLTNGQFHFEAVGMLPKSAAFYTPGPIAVNEEARISATFTSNRGKDHTIAVSFVSDELNGVRGECTVLNVN
ncbi:unnamed protein product [Porites lobata]|uniref:Transglutaminase-like domain-containing protein n=1 Tax=Porites lobata TaxID=104759 RepID=A0ABN8MU83_9CNID|nr:unnamed protein product [Porites lobata]